MSVKVFYESLTGREKDIFGAMAVDLQSASRQEKIQRLREFLQSLKREIDEINARRRAVGDMLDNVVAIRQAADKRLDPKQGGKPDLELELFRDTLLAMEQSLKEEIAELRPDKKLEKKFDVARRIENLLCRASLAERLQIDVLGKKTNPQVDGSDVATKHTEMAAARAATPPEVEKKVTDVVTGKVTGPEGQPAGFPQSSAATPDPGPSAEEPEEEEHGS